MIQVGVLNFVFKGQLSFILQVFNEVDLLELLFFGECVWVIDVNIFVDMMDIMIIFLGDFMFDVIYIK